MQGATLELFSTCLVTRVQKLMKPVALARKFWVVLFVLVTDHSRECIHFNLKKQEKLSHAQMMVVAMCGTFAVSPCQAWAH